jgi:hypothetical protein
MKKKKKNSKEKYIPSAYLKWAIAEAEKEYAEKKAAGTLKIYKTVKEMIKDLEF